MGSFRQLSMLAGRNAESSASRVKLPKIKSLSLQTSYKFLQKKNSDQHMTGTLQPFKQSSPEITYSKPVKETYDMQKLMHGGKCCPTTSECEEDKEPSVAKIIRKNVSSPCVDVRRRTSTCVDVRRRTSTYVVRRRTSTYVVLRRRTLT